MSNFAFLKAEWPEVLEPAAKAENLVHCDPRTSCFYMRRAHRWRNWTRSSSRSSTAPPAGEFYAVLMKAIALLIASAGISGTGCTSRTVYFGDSLPGICRVAALGGAPEVVNSSPAMVEGIVQSQGDRVLYAAQQTGIIKFGSSGKNLGGLIETSNADCIALDSKNGRLYWGDQGARQVASCDLQGQDKRVLVTDVGYPEAVAVSPANGLLFWARESGVGRGVWGARGKSRDEGGGLWRARLDGTDARQLTHEDGLIIGIAVEEGMGRLYWVRPGSNVGETRIMVADFDGKGSKPVIQGLGLVRDLAVDDGRLYWSERSKGIERIRRMKTDGTGIATVVQFDRSHGARCLTIGSPPRRPRLVVIH